MPKHKYRSVRVIDDANRIVSIWQDNLDFKLGTVTLPDLQATIDRLAQYDEHVRSLKSELVGALNRRDDTAYDLNQLVVRARSGIRGYFGPDSSQYEQAGGTRTSERKPRKRKAKPAAKENSSQ